jgi:hypothetical protein
MCGLGTVIANYHWGIFKHNAGMNYIGALSDCDRQVLRSLKIKDATVLSLLETIRQKRLVLNSNSPRTDPPIAAQGAVHIAASFDKNQLTPTRLPTAPTTALKSFLVLEYLPPDSLQDSDLSAG